MSGINFKFKWLSFIGKIPKTQTLEEQHTQLLSDHKRYQEFSQSAELQSYLELEKRLSTEAFKKRLESIKADTFEKTPEFKKWSEYQQLKKNSLLKKYFKYKESGLPQWIATFSVTKILDQFNELDKLIQSSSFKTKLNDLKTGKELSGSEEEKQVELHKSLKKNQDIKKYFKIIKSSKYQIYLKVEKSKELKQFNELDELINSQDFQNFKAEKEDTERYKRTAEFQELEGFEALKKRPDFVWYFQTKAKNSFSELESWELTFSDDFKQSNLNTEKWITHYYWGKALLNEGYSLASDKHFLTAGKNIQIKDGILQVITKKESVQGKAWDSKIGFYPREFAYTSGIISTGESFRQAYGKFEAKLKLNASQPVTNAFWLASEKIIPEIDIVKTDEQGKLIFANHWGPQMQSSISKYSNTKYKTDWFIYGINWTPEKIQWTINGVVLKEEFNGVPKEKMYLVLNSGLYADGADNRLPTYFDIDWVRVYQKRK